MLIVSLAFEERYVDLKLKLKMPSMNKNEITRSETVKTEKL